MLCSFFHGFHGNHLPYSACCIQSWDVKLFLQPLKRFAVKTIWTPSVFEFLFFLQAVTMWSSCGTWLGGKRPWGSTASTLTSSTAPAGTGTDPRFSPPAKTRRCECWTPERAPSSMYASFSDHRNCDFTQTLRGLCYLISMLFLC